MEATQRPFPLRNLSEFLVEHQSHGQGFDIAHPEGVGSGKLSMTCRGCGATFDYSLDAIEVEREIEFTPVPAAGAPPVQELVPEAGEKNGKQAAGGKSGAAKDSSGKRSGHSTRDRVAIAALLVAAIVAIVIAVTRISADREGGGGEPAAPEATTPAKTAPGAAPETQKPAQPAKPAQPKTKLVGTSLYTLSVPEAWSTSDESGGKLYAPAGDGPASVLVFSEQSSTLSSQEMTERTAEFLGSQAPGGSLSDPRALRVSGLPAFELRDTGDGIQIARGVFADPRRFLIVASLPSAASPAERAEVERALGSFSVR